MFDYLHISSRTVNKLDVYRITPMIRQVKIMFLVKTQFHQDTNVNSEYCDMQHLFNSSVVVVVVIVIII